MILVWFTEGRVFLLLLRGEMRSFNYVMPHSISVSPNGERATFTVFGKKLLGHNAFDVFGVTLNDGSIRQITKDGMSESPSWFDDKSIIIDSRSKGLSRLVLLDTRSNMKTVLKLQTANDIFYSYRKPLVALNGKKIIFIRGELDKKNIYIEKLYRYDMDTSKAMEIETSSVKISPDSGNLETRVENIIKEGHRFAWQVSLAGDEIIILKDETLFQYDLKNQNKKVLLKERDIVDFDYRPPHIVILKQVKGRGYKMFIKDLESNKELSISDTANSDTAKIYYNPKWSPSGRFIAYADSNNKETWLYDVEEKKNLKVTEGVFQAWVNDDELIILREKVNLFIVSTNGRNLRQIFPSQDKGLWH